MMSPTLISFHFFFRNLFLDLLATYVGIPFSFLSYLARFQSSRISLSIETRITNERGKTVVGVPFVMVIGGSTWRTHIRRK